MEIPNTFKEKKNIIIEVVVLCLFLFGMYYVYSLLSTENPTVTTQDSGQFFGPNLTMLMKAVNEDHLMFKDVSFMNTELVRQLQDFSEVINPALNRGRDDPFVPYNKAN